jgi:hypothetical protein
MNECAAAAKIAFSEQKGAPPQTWTVAEIKSQRLDCPAQGLCAIGPDPFLGNLTCILPAGASQPCRAD